MEQYVKQLNNIIYTLNQVTVRGKENLDCLLASIQSLEKMKDVMVLRMAEGKTHVIENK